GVVLGKMEKHEEALNCFELVCKKNPRHLDAIFHKGIELAQLDRHEKAINIFDDLLRQKKDNVNVIYAKARSLAALNQDAQSLEMLKKAISKDPKTIRKWAKAEKIFERFHENDQFNRIVR
ncbi:MAG TPA: tetratricopeptide repeat protein, partial [Nitrosopumilaceae archaeon]|nr:tetratricopeptide repeat protein [Nitrosopumilaceae archaeon]